MLWLFSAESSHLISLMFTVLQTVILVNIRMDQARSLRQKVYLVIHSGQTDGCTPEGLWCPPATGIVPQSMEAQFSSPGIILSSMSLPNPLELHQSIICCNWQKGVQHFLSVAFRWPDNLSQNWLFSRLQKMTTVHLAEKWLGMPHFVNIFTRLYMDTDLLRYPKRELGKGHSLVVKTRFNSPASSR